MDIHTLRILINRYEFEVDLDQRMFLANAMIDIVKREVWALVRKIRLENLEDESNENRG